MTGRGGPWRGALDSKRSSGAGWLDEVQVWVVLEEVALAQPDRRWLAWKCTVLQQWQVAREGESDRGVMGGEDQMGFALSSMLTADKG
jgi:hypothetical protein